jgi:hypothetical protein
MAFIPPFMLLTSVVFNMGGMNVWKIKKRKICKSQDVAGTVVRHGLRQGFSNFSSGIPLYVI